MTYHCYIKPSPLAAKFEKLGISTKTEINNFYTLKPPRQEHHQPSPSNIGSRLRQVKNEAEEIEWLACSKVSAADPAAQILRHYNPILDKSFTHAGERELTIDTKYVEPTSIQSSQSPAAYLKHIYDLATQIAVYSNGLSLSVRRPDILSFVLSEESLHHQVSTLSIVNQILIDILTSGSTGATDEAALFNGFKEDIHPLSLPYDRDAAFVRESLRAVGSLSLNIIADRTRPNAFVDTGSANPSPLYNSITIPSHRLGLYDGHVSLLAEIPDDTFYGKYYGLTDDDSANSSLQFSDTFCSATSLSFEDYRALVRDDVHVEDETGLKFSNMYARFSAAGWYIRLIEDSDSRYRTEGGLEEEGTEPLSPLVHEIQIKCIHLHKRTGLPFHQLDWLLTTTMYTSPLYGSETANVYQQVLADGSALNVLAHYMEWRDRFGFSVDMFAAMLADINCYRRLGTDEDTLMHILFGEDASEVTRNTERYRSTENIVVGELERELETILRRGFQLTQNEWNAVLSFVTNQDLSMILDSLMMGRIYRVTMLFRTMGWSVLEGISLIRKLDNQLYTMIGGNNSNLETLYALDKVCWLSDWMKELKFTPTDMIVLLTEKTETEIYLTQDTIDWVTELKQELETHLVEAEDFFLYSSDSLSEEQWIEGLTGTVVDTYGLVMAEYEVIKAEVTSMFSAAGSNMDSDTTRDQIEELSSTLNMKGLEQNKATAEQISKKSASLGNREVNYLMDWMRSSMYETANIFMQWDLQDERKHGTVETGVRHLFDISRHVLIVDKLDLKAAELLFLTTHPEWICGDQDISLCFRQVFFLARFKGLLSSNASSRDWTAHFSQMEGAADDVDPMVGYETLSRLLDWPADDIRIMAEAEGGGEIGIQNGLITNAQQADFVGRQIAICREGEMGGFEVVALSCVGRDGFDWGAASAAARLSLRGFERGKYVEQAEGLVDEESRNALVDTHLEKVAGADASLKEVVTSSETLYRYLLLDVNVSKDVPTTRMLEMIGSVQLYITSMLCGIEEGHFVDKASFRREWDISQQYRMWEANEKLKLYPSMYIEPELRVGKSEIFEEFESGVSEEDLDDGKVAEYVHNYLSRVEGVCNVKSDNMFYRFGEQGADYYVCGLSRSEKNGYYYREIGVNISKIGDELRNAVKWGEWKKVVVPISSDTTFGMVPAFAWNRLFVLWLELNKGSNDSTSETEYFVQAKLSQRNMDGTFSEPWKVEYPSTSKGFRVDSDFSGPVAFYETVYDWYEKTLTFNFELKLSEPGVYRKLDLLVYGQSKTAVFSYQNAPFDDPVQLGQEGAQYESVATKMPPKCPQPHFSPSTSIVDGPFNSGTVNGTMIGIDSVEFDFSFYGLDATINDDGAMGIGIHMSATNAYFTLPSPELDKDSSATVTVTFESAVVTDENDGVVCEWANAREIFKFTARPFEGYSGQTIDIPMRNIPISLETPQDKLEAIFHSLREQEDGVSRKLHVSTQLELECVAFGLHLGERPVVGASCNLQLRDSITAYLMKPSDSNDHKHPLERYILQSHQPPLIGFNEDDPLPTPPPPQTIAIPLFSTAMLQVAASSTPRSPVPLILSLENQNTPESYLPDFLQAVDASEFGPLVDPIPPTTIDFDGPYGLYAWELFYYVPTTIASIYRQTARFQQARSILHTVYDPQAESPDKWKVKPLILQQTARSLALADPDQIAREQPRHYQLATIRYYLQTIMEQGDAYYRQQTTESLRLAKLTYTAAGALFTTEAQSYLETSTRDNWPDPTLSSVDLSEFCPPINQQIRDAYDNLANRLQNLRNWLSIDGQPLNIPLIAPPINPKQLMASALAGIPLSQVNSASQRTLPFKFEIALAIAKSAVKNLMYFGDLLTRALYRRDDETVQELNAALSKHVSENLEPGGQSLESMMIERRIIEEDLKQAKCYLKWYKRFAAENHNAFEGIAYTTLAMKRMQHTMAITQALIEGGLDLIPCIFGLAVGGAEPAALSKAGKEVSQEMAELRATRAESFFQRGDHLRRQQENEMESEAAEFSVSSLTASLEKLDYDYSQEVITEAGLVKKVKMIENLIDFHSNKTTNAAFNRWYVGQISGLYNSAFDNTVRFCRRAEKAYQAILSDTKIFVRAVWDTKYQGLLAGQSLMIDLQRMELSFAERYEPPSGGEERYSLARSDAMALEGLKRTGRAIFSVNDKVLFGEEGEGFCERRIRSVEICFMGNKENMGRVQGVLKLLGHRIHVGQGGPSSKRRTVHDLYGRQQIALLDVRTDTEDVETMNGRLKPFEKCGLDSTWMVSLPLAVKAIEAGRDKFGGKDVLDHLEDVVMNIRYTAHLPRTGL